MHYIVLCFAIIIMLNMPTKIAKYSVSCEPQGFVTHVWNTHMLYWYGSQHIFAYVYFRHL